MIDKSNSANFIQVIDPEYSPEKVEIVKEYDKDNVHYIEYSNGSVLKSTNTLPSEVEYINTEKWKTKKDFIHKMSWFNKILYYLWIIVLYNKLPESVIKLPFNIDCYATEDPFPQTRQQNEYYSYWHWNYWNPLTYVICALFVVFICITTIGISIMKIFKMSNLITIKIDNA